MNNSLEPQKDTSNNIKFQPIEDSDQRKEVVFVERRGAPTILTILVIFTIIGSLFSMGKSLLYDSISSYFGMGDFMYYLYAATCVGTMIGAIMMLSKKKMGLYIYSVCQAIFILLFILTRIPTETEYYSTSWTLLVVLPAAIFLFLYWSKDIRNYLTK
ncbi:hypothetical protein KORDIASMS9_04335 [Kordia sp. SMS9]|uniref:hypothetical protein n=1 Tax=Kordia sp. SMS9 TaxID=2282170 RepID=UPI000E0DE04D|nr:hypothetical protein [Kordia sp. SMS9]AXG72073.1 hypothetical protein KORDIASMS9_04335 [Kordia sp. SMS9]